MDAKTQRQEAEQDSTLLAALYGKEMRWGCILYSVNSFVG